MANHDISNGKVNNLKNKWSFKNLTAVDFDSKLFEGEDDDFNIFKGKSPNTKVLGTYTVEGKP